VDAHDFWAPARACLAEFIKRKAGTPSLSRAHQAHAAATAWASSNTGEEVVRSLRDPPLSRR
jgi:hypothetical protein